MDRRRRKTPRKNQLCLRLNDAQLLLLQRYAEHKDMSSEVDALRAIIDGLPSWLDRRDAEVKKEQAHSGMSSAPPMRASVRASPSALHGADKSPSSAGDTGNDGDDGGDDSDGEEVGDFGGRPRLKLPGLPMDGELS